MSIAEGVSTRIVYKAYASGAITANALADKTSDPGSSGGQILRRVSSTLNLAKDTYQSEEVRADRQIADFRHGVRRVTGAITGELSPATWFPFFEATDRATATAAISLSNTELTSAAADNATSKFTFGGGDPVASGLRVGDVIRFTNLSESANNNTNFLIVSFGGASNRDVTVYPAPTTMGADTTFNLSRPGKATSPPASSHVSRKFAFEEYGSDIDISRLFLECRVAGYRLSLPATGIARVEVSVLGRAMEVLTGASAPFFASPTAATTTGACAAVNGLLRVNGTTVGVVTGLDITHDLAATADAVVGQNFVPEIFLGRNNVSGTVTAFFEDATLINNFTAEDEVNILAYLTASSAVNAEAVTVYLPRVKFGGADRQTSGEGGQVLTLPFQALLYQGSTAGVVASTVRIVDTAAT